MGNDSSPILGALPDDKYVDPVEKIGRGIATNRPQVRRRVTGDVSSPPNTVVPAPLGRTGALSPLNPTRRPPGALTNLMGPTTAATPIPSNLNPASGLTSAQKQRRSIELTKK